MAPNRTPILYTASYGKELFLQAHIEEPSLRIIYASHCNTDSGRIHRRRYRVPDRPTVGPNNLNRPN